MNELTPQERHAINSAVLSELERWSSTSHGEPIDLLSQLNAAAARAVRATKERDCA